MNLCVVSVVSVVSAVSSIIIIIVAHIVAHKLCFFDSWDVFTLLLLSSCLPANFVQFLQLFLGLIMLES